MKYLFLWDTDPAKYEIFDVRPFFANGTNYCKVNETLFTFYSGVNRDNTKTKNKP